MSASAARENLWTPANIVTLTRILLVPVFVALLLTPWPALFEQAPGLYLAQPWIAALFFIVLALTDSLDGYLARSRNEVTSFGKFMDPLADKLLVCSALVALVELSVLPAWVVIIIICRDFIMSGIRLVAAAQGEVIAASWYGKFKTAFQMVAIVMFLVSQSAPELLGAEVGQAFHIASWVVMAIALVLTVVSLVDYFYHARFVLGFVAAPESDDSTEDSGGSHEVSGVSAEELAGEIIARAKDAGVTISTCESLTGGLIGSALTSIPGSSAVVRGGLITYATDSKHDLAGVSDNALDATGPVDEEVAKQMAEGSRAACKADVAIAVTGIAGPGGAEPGKPVGTVWLAVASPEGVKAYREQFTGARDEVRAQTVVRALELLRAQLG